MTASTKERIVDAGAELFARQGYTGTGLKQISVTAVAPFGSLYHFFPGGKQQLGEEVIRTSGAKYGQLIGMFFVIGIDPATSIERFFNAAAHTLRETGYADACPIATIALEVASTNDVLRQATADVFDAWITELVPHFETSGMSRVDASRLAGAVLSMLEGAFILARATRDASHVEVAGGIMAETARMRLATR